MVTFGEGGEPIPSGDMTALREGYLKYKALDYFHDKGLIKEIPYAGEEAPPAPQVPPVVQAPRAQQQQCRQQ